MMLSLKFQRYKPNWPLQVIFRSWSLLSKEEERDCLKKGCQILVEVTVTELFSKFGWNFRKRIGD
jgi:hypothetical protein